MRKKVYQLQLWKEYDEALERGKEAIIAGGFIVFPTDTLYGLGANALDEKAVERVSRCKRRPEDKPISVIVSDLVMLKEYCEVSDEVAFILQLLFPGPFTAILKAKKSFPKGIAMKGKVGVRIPHHIFITTMVRQLGFPITATSANMSGGKSPVRLSDVPKELRDGASFSVDGGPTKWAEGSTIIDFTFKKPKIIRKGARYEYAKSILQNFGKISVRKPRE